jgi:acetyl esterase/lipase
MQSHIPLSIFLALALAAFSPAADPKPQLLWPDGAPGAKGDKPEDKPTLTAFLPEESKAVGTAVVICPGGGYRGLATDHEGRQIGEWLNSLGVAGFILEYRHHGRGYGHPAPLQDAQRAIRTVRAGAALWKIDPQKIGIMGFSAGGHLASTAGTHFDPGDPNAADPIERISCRPDFMILCYAVIALGEPFTHRGSQENLLGKDAPPELVKSLSNEKQVTAETPPTFLFQTDEDTVVPAENSVQFYLALRRAKVPAELHIYRTGQHGVGLAQNRPGTALWPEECQQWMQGLKLLGKK